MLHSITFMELCIVLVYDQFGLITEYFVCYSDLSKKTGFFSVTNRGIVPI